MKSNVLTHIVTPKPVGKKKGKINRLVCLFKTKLKLQLKIFMILFSVRFKTLFERLLGRLWSMLCCKRFGVTCVQGCKYKKTRDFIKYSVSKYPKIYISEEN